MRSILCMKFWLGQHSGDHAVPIPSSDPIYRARREAALRTMGLQPRDQQYRDEADEIDTMTGPGGPCSRQQAAMTTARSYTSQLLKRRRAEVRGEARVGSQTPSLPGVDRNMPSNSRKRRRYHHEVFTSSVRPSSSRFPFISPSSSEDSAEVIHASMALSLRNSIPAISSNPPDFGGLPDKRIRVEHMHSIPTAHDLSAGRDGPDKALDATEVRQLTSALNPTMHTKESIATCIRGHQDEEIRRLCYIAYGS
ncbi:hypothetical protein K488DRAFT_70020 [Vararia minispora EC-137]|uniref:Uncharacterized protein n=1 Tax=Vararia minispora EC-137 TaxID=1314806 RepID=A0ACB8QNI8_9AGAM|nr:hypothetical protein K488DRAFT_70020 [Vararia minispora EC-137]